MAVAAMAVAAMVAEAAEEVAVEEEVGAGHQCRQLRLQNVFICATT